MKKTTILLVGALLCLNFCAKAQSSNARQNSNTAKNNSLSSGEGRGGALKVGDKLPEGFWTQEHTIYNNAKPVMGSYNQFKGKAIILDFWATWCSACLKGFPKMDSLQKKYSKYLKILMVNTYEKDTQEVLSKFYQQQQQAIAGFALSIIASDPALRNMFPIKSIPHYIWIGADGRIKAITDAIAVTEPQVKRLIAGLAINLKLKER